MKSNVKKLVKDPFVLLIAAVILVPGVLVVVGIANQKHPQSAAVNSVSQESSKTEQDQTSSATSEETEPITQAEKPAPREEAPTAPTSAPAAAPQDAGPVCDQSKKSAAEAARDRQRDDEDKYHERQKERLRFTTLITRKYWDEEMVRHQNVLYQIDTTFKQSLAAANC